MKKQNTIFDILVAFEKSLISRTRKLGGIYRAAMERGIISPRVMDEGRELTREFVDKAVKDGVRAFIVGAIGVESAIARICELSLPLATISLPYGNRRNMCTVCTDNKAIAKEAVRLLFGNRHFASYAYFPANGDPEWSEERWRNFRDIIKKSSSLVPIKLPHDGIAEMLDELPRPVGLFAANDSYAVELMGTCHKIGISIPADASVVGVDNEEFLCEHASPPLTSIFPDFEKEGYLAATAIADMLSGKQVPQKIMCGLKQSVIRKSAMGECYAESVVNRAMSIIDSEATSGLNVSDLCTRLRISRRLLDMRFREVKDMSPKDAIINRRLAALKKSLKYSDDPIAAVCAHCGFGSENHPKKLFRQRFGMTMRDYRNLTA